ncbi:MULTISPECIES: ABC transporter ATP-binding protein [Actinotignum]|uniref:ABC transporter ATP-binding protein n=3 Tax=Actinotignum timonense TaxID=1870995 RepID=A0AAW9HJT5_9ACTO|nr:MULTISPECIES: ABC transporter ATP-binding protein [Actinotignum]MDE1557887.1 ABC transporter ATP-binding protein [Actinotignum schaalii]MDE1662710.1 ABC transporter ATP-binding protein [Actinotignum schaalii]MDK6373265.1 ABC transporter ATP-binding protein [Actinotignum timonense]MDK6418861.1 ABC transporter ATP-binding protein [Actinotignum timonense]MDK6590816.1 ABC transporter ATP-binding protein [Actinotignum timonense]
MNTIPVANSAHPARPDQATPPAGTAQPATAMQPDGTAQPAAAKQPDGTAQPAVSARALSRHFGNVRAVDNIDLGIDTGEIVALLGPNGAGKTTLLDMVLGFTKPSRGTLEVLGQTPGSPALTGHIGAMLQTGGMLRDLTAAETLRFLADCLPFHLPVSDVIERAGMSDFASRKIAKCSGGQIQRIRFGAALLSDPELLILDEPTAGLDATARRDFWEHIRADAARGRTIIFATHYLQEAQDLAERVILMNNGRIVADGSVADITAQQRHHLTVTWNPQAAISPEELARRTGADTVARDGDLVRFTVADSDRLAAVILNEGLGSHLQISAASLEDAFFSLTASPHTDSPAAAAPEGALS